MARPGCRPRPAPAVARGAFFVLQPIQQPFSADQKNKEYWVLFFTDWAIVSVSVARRPAPVVCLAAPRRPWAGTQCGPQPTPSASRSLRPARAAADNQGELSLYPVRAAACVQCGPKPTTGAGRGLQPGRAQLAPSAGRGRRPVRAKADDRRGPQPTTRASQACTQCGPLSTTTASQASTQCGPQPASNAGRSLQPARAAAYNQGETR